MSSKNSPTRNRILEATWHLLEARSGNVRMSDIAKRAGVSRQAVYLHFPNRAELLVATTRYIDDAKQIDERLAASRAATSGPERLSAFIEAWGNYIPEIYGVGSALMAMGHSDEEARQAWADRMSAVREGCAAAVSAIDDDGWLPEGYTHKTATDLLWTLLSVENWAQITQQCGWTQEEYIERITGLARAALVA